MILRYCFGDRCRVVVVFVAAAADDDGGGGGGAHRTQFSQIRGSTPARLSFLAHQQGRRRTYSPAKGRPPTNAKVHFRKGEHKGKCNDDGYWNQR